MPADARLQDGELQTLSQHVRGLKRQNQAAKPQQKRIPWTSADTEHLIDLIPVYHGSWAQIAENAKFEVARNQQAVRDRARNVKVLFLASDLVLPAGFDLIGLGPKEREAVRRAGKNPDRSEDDLDEDGEVINNVLLEED